MKIKYNKDIYVLNSKRNKEKTIVTLEEIDYVFEINQLDNIFSCDIRKQVFKAEDDKYIYIYIDGEYFKFEKIDEEFGISSVQLNDADYEYIYSPTPGNIIKVLVKDGQTVSEGVPLVIIESMKMENTIYSSIAGIVSNIQISEGEQVSNEKLILEIKRLQ